MKTMSSPSKTAQLLSQGKNENEGENDLYRDVPKIKMELLEVPDIKINTENSVII